MFKKVEKKKGPEPKSAEDAESVYCGVPLEAVASLFRNPEFPKILGQGLAEYAEEFPDD